MMEKKLILKKQVIKELSDQEKATLLGGGSPSDVSYTCPLTLSCPPPYSDGVNGQGVCN